MALSQVQINILKITGIAMFFILGACLIFFLAPQPSAKKKKVYQQKEFSLFDSTFAIRSQYLISKDSSVGNPNPQMFENLSIADYDDENINLALFCYKYKANVSLDTGYERMVRLFLYSTDSETHQISTIKARKTLIIDGKKVIKFSGEKISDEPQYNKDYVYDKFDILIQKSPPYTYMIFFGYNLNHSGIDTIKEKMYNSIRITQKN